MGEHGVGWMNTEDLRWVSTECLEIYEHGVHGMGEQGVLERARSTSAGIGKHGVPVMEEHEVPSMRTKEYLTWGENG